jgi:thymidylate kinase
MNEITTFEACRQLLKHLNKLRFPFAELRPKPLSSDECFKGDYDFLYNGEKKPELIREIALFLKNKGVSFVILRKNRHKLQVQIFDYENGQKIILEFWSVSVISPSLSAFHYSSALTWKDLEKFISPTKNYYRINPNIRALIYITHLKAKKKDLKKPETVARLKYFREQCLPEEPGYGPLTEIFGDLAEGKKNLRGGNRKALALLKEAGSYRPVKAFFYAMGTKTRSLFPKVSSPRLIAVVGPDGVGKTTIIKKAIAKGDSSLKYYKFKDLYRKHNGIDKLIRKYYPDRSLKRNQIDERVSGVHFLWSYIVFFFFRILYFRKLVILDRYFYDLLLTGIRDKNRRGHEVWWYRLGCFLAPRPRCLLILDVPYEIAKKRKDEISEEDWGLIFNNYLRCYFSKPSKYLAFCNTDTKVEDSVSFFNFVKEITLK